MTNHELTKKQIFHSRLVLGTALGLLGTFLLLCGVGVLPFSPLKILAASSLIALALVCFIWAFIQDNTLMLWLSFPLFFAAIVSILAGFTSKGYGFYYPIYIISPAVASLVTATCSSEWKDHLKMIILFTPSSIIFALNSVFNVSWAIVIPILLIFIGSYIIFYTILRRKK